MTDPVHPAVPAVPLPPTAGELRRRAKRAAGREIVLVHAAPANLLAPHPAGSLVVWCRRLEGRGLAPQLVTPETFGAHQLQAGMHMARDEKGKHDLLEVPFLHMTDDQGKVAIVAKPKPAPKGRP